MQKLLTQAAAAALILSLLTGCAGTAAPAADKAADSADPAPLAVDAADLFSSRDLAGTWDSSAAVEIQLLGDTAACDGQGVAIDGSRITIAAEGIYRLSGTLNNGQVVVDAGDASKVQLVLSGAQITSATSAALYALSADKVFLTLDAGTENALSNGGVFTAVDENNIDSAIFAKTDLTCNGSGSLTVTSPGGHGVVSKDELTITGGAYTIDAGGHGLEAKDSIAVADGSFTITAGKDGIHSENSEDGDLGLLYIAQGTFVIDAQGDGISASGAMQVDGGSFTMTTGGGSESVTMALSDTAGRQPGGSRPFPGGSLPSGRPEGQATPPSGAPDSQAHSQDASANTTSSKGLKAGAALAVTGGSFTLDTADDSIHAAGDIRLSGAAFTIRTGDDGVHSDAGVAISGGKLTIPYCYEGVEGMTVAISAGVLDITAHDDGINAAGGADGSGTATGFGPQDPFAADDSCAITISGGTITIVSNGDSIDSNGALTVTGGVLDLTCNGNGNTALDANGQFTHSGGEITTNDGSETGVGGFGGKGGGKNRSPR